MIKENCGICGHPKEEHIVGILRGCIHINCSCINFDLWDRELRM